MFCGACAVIRVNYGSHPGMPMPAALYCFWIAGLFYRVTVTVQENNLLFICSYAIAVGKNHVDPFLPYIR